MSHAGNMRDLNMSSPISYLLLSIYNHPKKDLFLKTFPKQFLLQISFPFIFVFHCATFMGALTDQKNHITHRGLHLTCRVDYVIYLRGHNFRLGPKNITLQLPVSPTDLFDVQLGSLLEHKICALAINRSCHFLFLVLVSPQTTHILRVYNVFRTWVV